MADFQRSLIASLLCFVCSGCLSYASTLHISQPPPKAISLSADDVADIVAKVKLPFSLESDPWWTIILYQSALETESCEVLTIASFVGSMPRGNRRILILVNERKADRAPSVFIRSWDSLSNSQEMAEVASAIRNAIEVETGPGTVRVELTPDTPIFLAP